MKSGTELSYLNARQEHNDRYYDLAKLANNWRLAFFGGLAVAVIASGGLVAVSLQQKVVPYAIELNGNSEVVRVTRADVASKPNANQVKASLRTWLIGARTVYGDPFAQQNHVDTTYAMTLPNSAAYQTMVEYHKANDPFVRSKKETVEVAVNAVVPTTDKTWQIEWTETIRDLSGRVISVSAWQGSATVAIIPPTTDRQILVNPLGVYVEQFAWTARS